MKRPVQPPPTPEERRRALIRNQREATRVVRRTLIGIAIFGALWYLFILSRAEQNPVVTERSDASASAAGGVPTGEERSAD